MPDATNAPEALPFDLGTEIAARFARASAAAAKIEADLAAKIAPLKKAADTKLAPIAAELEETKADAERWWKAHGDKVRGTKKSAEMAGCVLGTRASPRKLLFAHGDDKAAVKALRDGGFLKLLQRVFLLDKAAISDRVEAQPDGDVAQLGFSLKRDETFYIEPATRTGRKG